MRFPQRRRTAKRGCQGRPPGSPRSRVSCDQQPCYCFPYVWFCRRAALVTAFPFCMFRTGMQQLDWLSSQRRRALQIAPMVQPIQIAPVVQQQLAFINLRVGRRLHQRWGRRHGPRSLYWSATFGKVRSPHGSGQTGAPRGCGLASCMEYARTLYLQKQQLAPPFLAQSSRQRGGWSFSYYFSLSLPWQDVPADFR